MSGGAKRRFPRTARAMPQAGATIERDKIKHRRPNDMLFDEGDTAIERQDVGHQGVGHQDDVAEGADDVIVIGDDDADWPEDHARPVEEAFHGTPENYASEVEPDVHGHEGDGGYVDQPAWEDEPDDEWGDDDAYGQQDESGIVWGDDGETRADADGIVFDDGESEQAEWAPEVELAGRRDVRPKPPKPRKPPKPASKAREAAPARPTRRVPPDHQHRQDSPPDATAVGVSRAPRPVPPPASLAPNDGRFTRTRATVDSMPPGRTGGDGHGLSKSRAAPSQRRRKAHPTSGPNTLSRRRPRGWGKRIGTALVILGLAIGGWLIYPIIKSEGIGPAIERLVQQIPLPGSDRTAADTPFDNSSPEQSVSAQQALSDLQRQSSAQGGPENALSGGDAIDPATVVTGDPPIPAFKPTPRTRSIGDDQAEIAAGGGDGGNEGQPTIFEQIWQYLSPG